MVHLFKKCCSLLPQKSTKLSLYVYPLPMQRRSPKQWFSENPMGVSTLKTTVKRLAKQVNLQGQFTNHSLRATAATRMYQAGINEQTIMEYTGHKSEAVRSYKKPSRSIMKNANRAVSGDSPQPILWPVVPEPKPFDIDDVVIDKSVIPVMTPEESVHRKSHQPRLCNLVHGGCTEMCSVLKSLDSKTGL